MPDEKQESSGAESPMEKLCDLPDGRVLYYAGERFVSPGYYVADDQSQVKVDLTPPETESEADAPQGMFETFAGADGQTYWHLKAANGEIVAASEGYTSPEAARDGAQAVKRAAAGAEIVDADARQAQGEREQAEEA